MTAMHQPNDLVRRLHRARVEQRLRDVLVGKFGRSLSEYVDTIVIETLARAHAQGADRNIGRGGLCGWITALAMRACWDHLNSGQVFLLANQGCADAWTEVETRVKAIVRNVSRSLSLNAETEKDVFQETIFRAYRKAADYDPERPFDNWIRTIARRIALNTLEREGNRRQIELTHKDSETDINDIAALARDTTSEGVAAREILRAILTLDIQDQEVLFWRLIMGLSWRDVAHKLGLSEEGAQKRYKAALGRLQRKLKTDGQ